MFPGKLSDLSDALIKDGEEGFDILFQYFHSLKHDDDFYKPGGYSKEEIRLVLGKQVFPYEIMIDKTCFEKLRLRELPPIEAFRNNLTLEDLEPKLYEHALNVWRTFNIKNFGQYSRFYCLIDTLILACVVESQKKQHSKNTV